MLQSPSTEHKLANSNLLEGLMSLTTSSSKRQTLGKMTVLANLFHFKHVQLCTAHTRAIRLKIPLPFLVIFFGM
jgi:hypothetical protein